MRCFHDVVINKILRLRTWRLSWGPFLHVLRSTIYSIHIMFFFSCWWFFSSRYLKHHISTQCFKIAKKVAFNIVSEARYVFILSGQKLIKNAKNGPFWRDFENLKLVVKQCYQMVENPKKEMRHFWVIFKHCDQSGNIIWLQA